jgi:hypothetical protein
LGSRWSSRTRPERRASTSRDTTTASVGGPSFERLKNVAEPGGRRHARSARRRTTRARLYDLGHRGSQDVLLPARFCGRTACTWGGAEPPRRRCLEHCGTGSSRGGGITLAAGGLTTVLWLSCPTCRFSATSDERPTYATSPVYRNHQIPRDPSRCGRQRVHHAQLLRRCEFRRAGLRACLVFSGAYGPGLPAVDGVCRVSRVWRRKRTSSFTRSMTMEGLAAQQRLVGPTVDIKTR